MTLYDVDVEVDYLDAAERIATKTYRLQNQYDTTANTGAGNMGAILTDVSDLLTALNVLTWDGIVEARPKLVIPSGGSANIAANNQVEAFIRCKTGSDNSASFSVPAWDDDVFDQDSNNLLSAAFNTAAQAVADMINDPVTGDAMGDVQWSQSRAHKSRGKKLT